MTDWQAVKAGRWRLFFTPLSPQQENYYISNCGLGNQTPPNSLIGSFIISNEMSLGWFHHKWWPCVHAQHLMRTLWDPITQEVIVGALGHTSCLCSVVWNVSLTLIKYRRFIGIICLSRWLCSCKTVTSLKVWHNWQHQPPWAPSIIKVQQRSVLSNTLGEI